MENNKIKISVKIREAIHSLLRICINELRHIFSDAGVMVLIFAVPLIYPMLYSLIYYPEVVRDLPIAL
jgi:ABC-2 type transport system permease protein